MIRSIAMHLVALLMAFFLLAVGDSTFIAYADDVEYDVSISGDNSIKAVLSINDDSETYTLTISGTGSMKDFGKKSNKRPPWYADYGSKISKVIVKPGVTHIGNYSFDGANGSVLVSAVLSDGLQTIGSNAFSNTVMEDISIPESVNEIRNNAFADCNAVIDILGNNTSILVEDTSWGKVGKTVKAFEDSLTVKNWIELSQTTLEIKPSYSYSDEEKTVITGYLAHGTDVTIPDSVITIREGAFSNNTDIVNVNLNNVSTIESKAFQNCNNLKTVLMPKTVTTIAEDAFTGCPDTIQLLVNNDSVAKLYAETNGYDFVILKPYRLEGVNESFEKTLPIGDSDEIKLSEVFGINYNSELRYQVKIGESDYQNIDNDIYVFSAVEVGNTMLVFRAVDQYNEPSDDTYTANYTVVSNSVPVLNPEKAIIEERVLFGEQKTIDLKDAFTDADGDALSYKYVDHADVSEDNIDWDTALAIPGVVDNAFLTPSSWTQYPTFIGRDHEFCIKAYDKWNKPSENYLKIKFKTHSTKVIVNSGAGVHSLDNITIKFSRDGADDVTEPNEVVDNSYYFDLDYVIEYPYGPDMPVYRGGYDYVYDISLEGCETVSGAYTTTKSSSGIDNTIEVTLANPAQAEADAKAVADLIKAIDNLGDITLESEDAVNAAQAAYEALYDDLKPQVTNYNKLLEAKLELANLKLKAAEDELKQAKKDKETTERELNEAKNNLQEAEKEKQKAEKELQDLKDEIATKALKVSGLKVTSKAKKFTVKWKKNSKAEGYQVQYKLKSAKTFKNLKKSTTKISVKSKKLKKGKKYQFRVRPYKTINGNKIYGKWVVKAVKCK